MSRRNVLISTLVLMLLVGCDDGSWQSGDRVLVTKFPYETNITPPQRYDVVVFKYPGKKSGGLIEGGPVEKGIPKNYIKRLLGLPGELLAIFFGRLFHWTPDPAKGELPLYTDDKNPEIKAENLWEWKYMHENDDKALEMFRAGKFEILRKTPAVMLAQRRIVYDNDFQAEDLKRTGFPPRWHSEAGSGWTAVDTKFNQEGQGKKGDENVDWLRYQHVLRPLNGDPLVGGAKVPELITDHLGYNSSLPNRYNRDDAEARKRASRGRNWVGDLMVECQLDVKQATGEVWLELSKGTYRYQARFKLDSGDCTLWRKHLDGKTEQLGEAKTTKLKGSGNFLVRLANIDARLTVWVDSTLPFEDGFKYPPPEVRAPGENISEDDLMRRRGPHDKNDLQPASIGSVGASVQIQHLRLWRDTYYTTHSNNGDEWTLPEGANQRDGVGIEPDMWAAPETFDKLRALRPKTLYVQPGHYLCLGDNSPESSDGRDWGLVPHRLMLGRALLVYFPFNRAGLIR